MKGIVVTTENVIIVKDFEPPLYKSVGESVGGYIEIVRPTGLERPLVMIVNEEGLIKELPFNILGSMLYGTQYHGSPILGDIVIMQEVFTSGGPDITGIPEEAIDGILNQLFNIMLKIKGNMK